MGFCCAYALLVMWSQLFRLRPEVSLSEQTRDKLILLADSALRNRDVPVGALLTYRGEIIGMGYNTVFSKGNAGGHAEINAISDAMRQLGPEHFDNLHRDDLLMISTFEPCAMCRGAMWEYGISRVEFLKPKKWTYWIRRMVDRLQYQMMLREVKGGNEIQDSLFYLHPGYLGKKN